MTVRFQNQLLIATKNKGKAAEFSSLFAPLGIEVTSLNDVENAPDVIEDGDTFFANAFKKARTIAETFGLPTLADDSGLCVDVLQGAPGVISARYAGEHASDEENNQKLLQQLSKITPISTISGVDPERPSDSISSVTVNEPTKRPKCLSTARFVSVLVLYDPNEKSHLHVEGVCEGFIIDEPRGIGGFGYDPLFYIPEAGLTMAQLSMEHKNKISHRGRALQQLLQQLKG